MAKENQSGFTIVELLITIAICGIMIPLLSTGLSNLALLNNRARDLSLANMLAQNKAELLRSSGFASITTGTTSFTGDLPPTLSSPKSASYTVTSPAAGVKDVDIEITYRDINSSRTVNYKTVITEIGVGQ